MNKYYSFVVMTGILSGFIVFGGKVLSNMGLSAYELALLPTFIPIIALLPFVIYNKRYRFKSSYIPLFFLYGFVCAVCAFTEFGAVVLGVPVAIAVLLLYSQPLWSVLFTALFMKEKITRKEILACAVVLIGVVLLVNPFGEKMPNLAGTLVALVGGMGLAGWIVVGSYASKKNIPPITTRFGEGLFQIPFLIILYPVIVLLFNNNPAISSFSFIHSPKIIIGIIVFSLVTQVLGHLLYFAGMKKVPTLHASVILLLEPVVGTILAYLFLGQAITASIVLGGALILVANVMVIKQ